MRFAKQWGPAIAWAAVILLASNDSFSSEHSRAWLRALFGDTALDVLNFAVRKLAHFVEYAILGALAWRADRRLLVALGFAMAVAVVDETQQAFTMFRTGSPFDVLLDCAGAATGLAFLRWRRPPPPLPT